MATQKAAQAFHSDVLVIDDADEAGTELIVIDASSAQKRRKVEADSPAEAIVLGSPLEVLRPQASLRAGASSVAVPATGSAIVSLRAPEANAGITQDTRSSGASGSTKAALVQSSRHVPVSAAAAWPRPDLPHFFPTHRLAELSARGTISLLYQPFEQYDGACSARTSSAAAGNRDDKRSDALARFMRDLRKQQITKPKAKKRAPGQAADSGEEDCEGADRGGGSHAPSSAAAGSGGLSWQLSAPVSVRLLAAHKKTAWAGERPCRPRVATVAAEDAADDAEVEEALAPAKLWRHGAASAGVSASGATISCARACAALGGGGLRPTSQPFAPEAAPIASGPSGLQSVDGTSHPRAPVPMPSRISSSLKMTATAAAKALPPPHAASRPGLLAFFPSGGHLPGPAWPPPPPVGRLPLLGLPR